MSGKLFQNAHEVWYFGQVSPMSADIRNSYFVLGRGVVVRGTPEQTVLKLLLARTTYSHRKAYMRGAQVSINPYTNAPEVLGCPDHKVYSVNYSNYLGEGEFHQYLVMNKQSTKLWLMDKVQLRLYDLRLNDKEIDDLWEIGDNAYSI